MKKIKLIFLAVLLAQQLPAQTRDDIFGNAPVTWLGLDLTHLKFVGKPTQYNNTGAITNDELRSEYFLSWNDLFFKEHNKFNVARATHRDFVGYAMKITQQENTRSTRMYITDNELEYQLLTPDSVSKFVDRYDFGQKKGIGLLFFVEGMNKRKREASMWVTFVDMGNKKVLLTERMTGLAGGGGFRNFWARSFSNVLWDLGKDLNK